MVETFCTTAQAEAKAGANASAAGKALAPQYINEAEGRINSQIRYDYITNYASVNASVKELLREATSNLAGVYIIIYDMSGYTSRIEAEDMIQTLLFNFRSAMKLLDEDKTTTFALK